MTDLTMSQFASKDDLLAAQAARIAELESQLEAIGAGGVEPLRKPAAAPQAVQAAVPETREALAKRLIADVKVADTIATAACQRVAELPDRDSPADWPEAMLVTGDELHMIVREAVIEAQAAPAHPAEGVPAQAGPVGYVALAALTSRTHADDYAKCFATEAALLENYPAAKAIAVFDHAATQPAAQGMDALGAHGHQERSA